MIETLEDDMFKKYGTWYKNYLFASEYYKQYHDLLIPNDYNSENGVSLSNWVKKQRHNRKKNLLSSEQIALLNDIHMIWDLNEFKWFENYKLAIDYYKKHHNLNIPYDYEVNDTFLGKWIRTQRKAYKQQGCCKISKKQIDLLNEIGMVWDVKTDKWSIYYSYAEEFFLTNHHLNIPKCYCIGNYNLGSWLSLQKIDYKKGTLNSEKIQLLEKLHIIWDNKYSSWEDNYAVAKEFFEENGHLLVKQTYKKNGISLGSWINNQRQLRKHHAKSLTLEQIKRLDDIHMVWDVSKSNWHMYYKYANAFYKENGHLKVPSNYFVGDNYNLGKWVYKQKRLYLNHDKKLNSEYRHLLEEIHII